MRNKIIIVVILLAILGGLGTYVYKYANSGSRNCGVKYEEDYNNMNNAVYKELDQESAKKNLDENKDIVLIDVRTEEEYKSGHIKNSILIPLDDLENGIKNIYKEKQYICIVEVVEGVKKQVIFY